MSEECYRTAEKLREFRQRNFKGASNKVAGHVRRAAKKRS